MTNYCDIENTIGTFILIKLRRIRNELWKNQHIIPSKTNPQSSIAHHRCSFRNIWFNSNKPNNPLKKPLLIVHSNLSYNQKQIPTFLNIINVLEMLHLSDDLELIAKIVEWSFRLPNHKAKSKANVKAKNKINEKNITRPLFHITIVIATNYINYISVLYLHWGPC